MSWPEYCPECDELQDELCPECAWHAWADEAAEAAKDESADAILAIGSRLVEGEVRVRTP